MKENIYGLFDEALTHYKTMNWKTRQAMLNTSITLGLGLDFIRKVIETCYYEHYFEKFPWSREVTDRFTIFGYMKKHSEEAADIYKAWLNSMEKEEKKDAKFKEGQE